MPPTLPPDNPPNPHPTSENPTAPPADTSLPYAADHTPTETSPNHDVEAVAGAAEGVTGSNDVSPESSASPEVDGVAGAVNGVTGSSSVPAEGLALDVAEGSARAEGLALGEAGDSGGAAAGGLALSEVESSGAAAVGAASGEESSDGVPAEGLALGKAGDSGGAAAEGLALGVVEGSAGVEGFASGEVEGSVDAGGSGGREGSGLRFGWTTGACATAGVTAAYTALLTGEFPDPVQIVLPKGQRPSFALAREELGGGWAMAGVVKDAGDDPDVTHGALVMATVRHGRVGDGVTFLAGAGVGTVTKAGLPLEVGEPAINPVPRRMMREHIAEVAARHGGTGDVVVEISIADGEELARHTWNPRLGILGGLSVLGTTGVVVPYSCSAWIDSIRRGIDVARAAGHQHVAGCTGSTSELVAKELYGLPDDALLDMGDFAGAVLKYLRRHPVPRLTIAGGIGKLAKLADGHLDLHSGRSQVNKDFLATLAMEAGATDTLAAELRTANTALAALHLCQAANIPLGDLIAARARNTAVGVLREAPVTVDVVVIDRAGVIVGRA